MNATSTRDVVVEAGGTQASTADVLGFLVLAHTTAPYNAEGRIGDVTFASLRSLVLDLAASGEISNGGIANSLASKVANAEAAYGNVGVLI